MSQPNSVKLTATFEEALTFAHQLHQRQRRKASGVPYIAHLLGVTALVLEDGGDEEQAIAALLHDAVEDQGGPFTQNRIRKQFGTRVASLVAACTDDPHLLKAPWRERKERHIARMAEADPAVRRILAADKLYNARTILRDLRVHEDALWERFNGGKEGTLWYYRAAHDALASSWHSQLLIELDRVVTDLEQRTA